MCFSNWLRCPANEDGSVTLEIDKFYHYKKAFLLIVIIFLGLLIYFSVVLSICTSPKKEINYCLTKECLEAAAEYKRSMDLSIDPCNNFYLYTCGKWNKEHPDHRWYHAHSTYHDIAKKMSLTLVDYFERKPLEDEPNFIKKARNLYESCMNMDALKDLGLSVVIETLQKVNLPLLPSILFKDKTITNETFNWLETEVKIDKIIGLQIIFKLIVFGNTYNMTQNVVYINVPDSESVLHSFERTPRTKTYKENSKEKGKYGLYEAIHRNKLPSQDMLFESVIDELLKNNTDIVLDKQLVKTTYLLYHNISTTMSKITRKYKSWEENDNIYDPNTVSELQNMTDDFSSKTYPNLYSKYIEYMFQNTSIVFSPEKDRIYCNSKEINYFIEILSFWLELPESHMELYMWWKTVFEMLPLTKSTASDLTHSYKKLDGRPKSFACADMLTTRMAMASAYILASKSPKHEAKLKIHKIINEIKEVFIQRVKSMRWMDDQTKNVNIKKTKEVISFIGYPNWLLDNSTLEKYYENVTISSNTYLQNLLNLVYAINMENLNDLRKVNDRKAWDIENVNEVNAYNYLWRNTLYFTLGVLHFPAYSTALKVLAYGSIGTTIGHELMHAFDERGKDHGIRGEKMPTWSYQSTKGFEDLADCFIKMYDNESIIGIPGKSDGIKTLGENIADNGGLRQAYYAYQRHFRAYGEEAKLPGFENFSGYQMFFIAYGAIWCETEYNVVLKNQLTSDHLPKYMRLIGSLKNTDAFARAFNCPKGSKMNPRQKCKLY